MQSAPEQWETCEIKYTSTKFNPIFFNNSQIFFWAEAVGPNGIYEAARSIVCKAQLDAGMYLGQSIYIPAEWKPATEIYADFVRQLTQSGWENTGNNGPLWYQARFRRQWNPVTYEQTQTLAARELLAYLHKSGAKIKFLPPDRIEYDPSKVKAEIREKMKLLKPYLINILKQQGSVKK